MLSALLAPAAVGLDFYERGEEFSIGVAKLIACALILVLLGSMSRRSGA
jgi:hypothetical protein